MSEVLKVCGAVRTWENDKFSTGTVWLKHSSCRCCHCENGFRDTCFRCTNAIKKASDGSRDRWPLCAALTAARTREIDANCFNKEHLVLAESEPRVRWPGGSLGHSPSSPSSTSSLPFPYPPSPPLPHPPRSTHHPLLPLLSSSPPLHLSTSPLPLSLVLRFKI